MKNLQYHPYPQLDFASVKGMDGHGFLEKFAVSYIILLDLSNLFFVPVQFIPMEDVGFPAGFL